MMCVHASACGQAIAFSAAIIGNEQQKKAAVLKQKENNKRIDKDAGILICGGFSCI